MIKSKSRLSYKNNYLVIRNIDTQMIHLSELSTIVVDSTAVSVTAFLLNELAQQKINLIICDERHNPSGEYLPIYGNYHTSKKIKQQLSWQDVAVGGIWQSIVKQKIANQSCVLAKFGLADESSMLEQYKNEVVGADVTNREGHAAKVYFNALFGKEFSRDDDSYINAALNYGYSILLSAFNREIVSNGHLTQLGVFHRNEFNEFNLSCDLMEPYRPYVDLSVKSSLPFKFDEDMKIRLIDLINTEVIYDGKQMFLESSISMYTQRILSALDNNSPDDSAFGVIL